jgi:hypothetical protein
MINLVAAAANFAALPIASPRTVHAQNNDAAPHWTRSRSRSATIEDLLKPLLETSDGSTARMTENPLEVSYGGKQGTDSRPRERDVSTKITELSKRGARL